MKYLKSIIWPKKERVAKEALIVFAGTIGIGVVCLGIDTLAKYLLNLAIH